MMVQRTDWGEIQWLEEERQAAAKGSQRVGIVTLPAGGHQPRHVHYGEQAIYVLEGEAESTVDGVTTRIVPGDLFHWRAGIVHEVRNPLNVPFRHLLVSSPVPEGRDALPSLDGDSPRDVAPDLIYIAAEAVRTQFLETLPYGYALFDGMGNLILKGQSFPEYCRGKCGIDTCANPTDCMLQGAALDTAIEQVYRCPHGMEVYQYPIVYAGHLLGFIQAGYIRHSGAEGDFVGEVYDVPESVVAGVKALMRRIVKAIRNYCEFEQFRRELSERESQISDAKARHSVLMQDLRDTRYAMTDLKINNHFLFNTLNSMASMALDGGNMPLYQSIVDLSKMFHYTLRTQASIVPLYKELEYVKAYLQLQKLRWDGQLHVEWRIADAAREQPVPFNFLQPIVENAFTHGFHEAAEKALRIEVEVKNALIIRVTNSGATLTPQEYYAVNQAIRGNTAHGLSMVNHKLQGAYDERYDIRIGPADWDRGGTTFAVVLPYGGR